ncbi:N-acetylneuraminate synthase [Chitinolyticbacter meiyuanensis]|uniref:N-acetylneuraminate synthase n=1 Tax=Chitinolyticbacter meiyuanensis TaxID=682798 RepID=UPI0011E5C482|nr:N-acetylneuraminate synthase [Chitinolyticbacter meiyuanensis]
MTPWQDRVFVIAEAGVNHNGDVALALQLVDAAADAGADAVKFQTFQAAALVSRDAVTADYQKANTGVEESQYAMLKRLELSAEAHDAVRQRAQERGILFFSTAFDPASIDYLIALDIPLWKIPSGEITNYPYLCRIAALQRPTILSTGMATVAEIDDAVRVLLAHGLRREQLAILHCNTEYPTPLSDVNLRAMPNLGALFGAAYGYSDHTAGEAISVAAVALGARVIEKHFTLDRNLPGPDHKASLEPGELASMVAAIRAVETALGNGIKQPTPSEAKNRPIARKSIVAARAIRAGEVFGADNLAIKRPGTGISPMRWPELIGRTASRDYAEDEVIAW